VQKAVENNQGAVPNYADGDTFEIVKDRLKTNINLDIQRIEPEEDWDTQEEDAEQLDRTNYAIGVLSKNISLLYADILAAIERSPDKKACVDELVKSQNIVTAAMKLVALEPVANTQRQRRHTVSSPVTDADAAATRPRSPTMGGRSKNQHKSAKQQRRSTKRQQRRSTKSQQRRSSTKTQQQRRSTKSQQRGGGAKRQRPRRASTR
jgi:hypothetical protein